MTSEKYQGLEKRKGSFAGRKLKNKKKTNEEPNIENDKKKNKDPNQIIKSYTKPNYVIIHLVT